MDTSGNWRQQRRSNYNTGFTKVGPRALGRALGERGKCFNCQGLRHLARDCPNTRLPAKRDGQRCHKGGGLKHWASACSSPRHSTGTDGPRGHAKVSPTAELLLTRETEEPGGKRGEAP